LPRKRAESNYSPISNSSANGLDLQASEIMSVRKSLPYNQRYNPQTPQPNSNVTKNKKKRKVNDDYGIFYNYTNESDSSQ